ncbi:uncharacterized protein [Argopecten irradians]|uniref:uncharacterized protein n=1 Tax=Argopecten irradians TaxID=31199 RepID=UPI003718B74F
MPSTCCSVPGCHNRGGHSFPTESKLRKARICAIKRGNTRISLWEPNQHSVVCKMHFMEIEIKSDISVPTTFTSSTQTPGHPMCNIYNFIDDDAGIHFYTGLENYSRFLFVLRTLGPAAYSLEYIGHQVCNLSVENQFFMTLMKLRRHTTNFELSRLFGISDNTVSNIVLTWINFMYLQWKELDLWPVRELVHHFTPSDFGLKFPTTRLIVDGTECPI